MYVSIFSISLFLAEETISQIESQQRHSWLQSPILHLSDKNCCRLTHEVRFAEKLRGLYSARFSKTGEMVAASFGNGCIQVCIRLSRFT